MTSLCWLKRCLTYAGLTYVALAASVITVAYLSVYGFGGQGISTETVTKTSEMKLDVAGALA